MLHEVINNGVNKTTIPEISEKFGKDVATIVECISKINKLELADDTENSAMYLRKVLVGLATDVRVLFIKLADRLHNMRTNYALDPEKQKQKAYETQAVLIPIAHRLGINAIKSELEDLCLYYTKRDVYEDILAKLNDSKDALKESLDAMQDSIINILTEAGLKFKIKSRVKSVHSIYHKLSMGKKWSDIYDILALRVILEKVEDCYLALGLVHAKYRPIPKRFKDYIAMPKANMYQSLHTTVFGSDGNLFEIQFRTFEMDEFAEKGMASHWSYKEHGTKKGQNLMEQKLELFRNIIETNEGVDDVTLAKDIRSDMLAEMIYVFTPKGDVMELPIGSTPVDFAYRIHSGVGDKIVGAQVNDVMVPLDYELHTNDIVKIKTSSNATPNKDWLNFVKTTQAKNKIKSYFNKLDRNSMIEKGKSIFENELRKRKIPFASILNDEFIKKVCEELKLKDLEDIYLSIGTLRYTAGFIISLNEEDKDISDVLLEKLNHPTSNPKNYKKDIIVDGFGDILVNIAKCCQPIKGDNIVGFVTIGQGITIHKSDCPNILDKKARLVKASWNKNSDTVFYTDLNIETDNNKNYLADLVALFTKRNAYVEAINTKEYLTSYVYIVTLKIKDKGELEKIIRDLENQKYVREVKRNTN